MFNVTLAVLLHEQGVVSVPESYLREPLTTHRGMPDVMVDFQGLRTMIEGKVDDQPAAEQAALQAARERVESGIAYIGVALVYPASLRQVPFPGLKNALCHTTMRIAVFSEVGESGWSQGDLGHLIDLLRRTYQQLLEEDVVTKAVDVLKVGVNEFGRAIVHDSAFLQKAKEILNIRELPQRTRKKPQDNEEEE
ncbi:MAG: hypothetical protein HYY01_10460 [Chloroflexi bacterium]|nr:hypothetical protein [Chloroflexota bacterium]